MTDYDGNLGRIAGALERIASSLEYLEQLAAASQPAPRLVVRRAPSDRSSLPAANMTEGDGRLSVTLLNDGDIAAELRTPRLRFGQAVENGGIIGFDGLPHEAGRVEPQGTIGVVFDLRSHGALLIADSPIVLYVPHSPGRFPGWTDLAVQLEPTGLKESRYGWKVTSSREVASDAAA